MIDFTNPNTKANSAQLGRREWLRACAGGVALAGSGLSGCLPVANEMADVDLVWGSLGTDSGKFRKPRAAAIDQQDQIYLVDMTARIQVFTADGEFLRAWSTPTHEKGRPCGLGINHLGEVMVADTHYARVLFYSPDGTHLEEKTIGGTRGVSPGEFACVSDATSDRLGNVYISEFSDTDRIQKYSPDGVWLTSWGNTGTGPGQFMRPQCVVVDGQDRVWVADSCNHRIQVFSHEGELLFLWGRPGMGTGELNYPYCLDVDGHGHVFICEYGNQRIQKFTEEGEFVNVWGSPGRQIGQLDNPWAMVRDSLGRLHVVDSENNRVQRIHFS